VRVRVVVALCAVALVFGGILALYRVDPRALNGSTERREPTSRLGRVWRWLGSRTPVSNKTVTMNCPICRRAVEVPSWQRPRNHAMYPEELIALCRSQNQTSCGPSYDWKRLIGP
jgi:hypothetical protein